MKRDKAMSWSRKYIERDERNMQYTWMVNKSGIWHRVIKLTIFHSFNELTCVVTIDLSLYKTISYIPFGQDKAVIKTGNASIQVTHIVLDSIPKFRSNVLC